MKLSELQIISYLHRVYVWRLALSEFWLCHLVSIYISLLLLLCLILTICTHKHYQIRSSRTQTQVYKPLFSCIFIPYAQHIFKAPCVFSIWPIWAFINNAKHRHFEFLLLSPVEKSHVLASSCISHVSHQNHVIKTTDSAVCLCLSVPDSWQPRCVLGAGAGESVICHRNEAWSFTGPGEQAAADGNTGKIFYCRGFQTVGRAPSTCQGGHENQLIQRHSWGFMNTS